MTDETDLAESEFAALRTDAVRAFEPPPMDWFLTTARRRRRQRVAIITAGVAAVVAISGVMMASVLKGPQAAPPPAESPTVTAPVEPSPTAVSESPESTGPQSGPVSTSPAPTKSAAVIDIKKVHWATATITMPPKLADSNCPTGRVTFEGGTAKAQGKLVKELRNLASGDLTGDGEPEVVLGTHCELDSPYESGDGGGFLMVVTVRENRLVGLGYVGPEGNNYPSARVVGRKLIATVEQRYGGQVVQERTYEWTGSTFKQVGGPTTFPSE